MKEELIKTLLLGTERKELEYKGKNSLTALVSKLESKSKEDTILNFLSVYTPYTKAGKLPLKLEENIIFDNPEKETQEYMIFSNFIFDSIISTNNLKLKKELFELIYSKNQIVTEKYLTYILEEGVSHPDLQQTIINIIGKKGLWLSNQNKKWNYVFNTDSDINKIWEQEKTKVRKNLLEKLANDNVDKAIELLKSTWKNESASDKESFLEILKEKLTLKHEYFLIDSMNTKSIFLKRKVKEILSNIQDSEIYKKISILSLKIVEESVRIKKEDKSEKYEFIIDYPVTYSKEFVELLSISFTSYLVEDNESNIFKINEKHLSKSVEKFIFHDFILKYVPLDYWEKKINLSGEEFLIAISNKKNIEFIKSLSLASKLQNNKYWLKILFQNNYNLEVFEKFSNQEKEEILKNKISKSIQYDYERYDSQILNLLNIYNTQWSYHFTEIFIENITSFNSERVLSYTLRYIYYFDPLSYEIIRSKYKSFFDKFKENELIYNYLDLINLRYQMHKEIKS